MSKMFGCSFIWKLSSVVFLTLFFAIISICYFDESCQWFVLAHMRIFLVQLLPFWNWTQIPYSGCLIRNPDYRQSNHFIEDENLCWPCEIKKNFVTGNYLDKFKVQRLIGSKTPMIFFNVTDKWPALLTLKDLQTMVDDKNWFPNHFESNIRQKHLSGSFSSIFFNQPFFVQWQNEEPLSKKQLRHFYRKLEIFPPSFSCIGPNWVFAASNYSATVYRTVKNTNSDWLWFTQVKGESRIQAMVIEQCSEICDTLGATLQQGTSVLIPQDVHTLRYLPNREDYLAVAVECNTL